MTTFPLACERDWLALAERDPSALLGLELWLCDEQDQPLRAAAVARLAREGWRPIHSQGQYVDAGKRQNGSSWSWWTWERPFPGEHDPGDLPTDLYNRVTGGDERGNHCSFLTFAEAQTALLDVLADDEPTHLAYCEDHPEHLGHTAAWLEARGQGKRARALRWLLKKHKGPVEKWVWPPNLSRYFTFVGALKYRLDHAEKLTTIFEEPAE